MRITAPASPEPCPAPLLPAPTTTSTFALLSCMYNSSFFACLSPNVIKIVPLYPYTVLPPAVYIISKSKKDKRAKISIVTLTPTQLPVAVGDIIEKLIDSRYIGIFSSYRQIIDIENVHLISSDKHCSKNNSNRVFYILSEYEFPSHPLGIV